MCNNGSRVCNVNGTLQCIHDIDRDCVEDEQVNLLKYSYTCKQKGVLMNQYVATISVY